MEVILAKTAGFCFGVKRAVTQVYEQIDTGKKIYTYGPIIHNENVVEDLEQKGVTVINEKEPLTNLEEGKVVIRSHGVPKSIYDELEKQGMEIVEATCPFVKKIHNIVAKESENGAQIVIIGNDTHPEVEGIKGWCKTPAIVIETKEDAKALNFSAGTKVCVVSQTTFNLNKFQELVEIIRETEYDINVVNTICNATEERQTEAAKIAGQVNTMIVIGGTHSSNSQKLYEICKSKCENTFFIQTLKDLTPDFKPVGPVGITAGASTPNNIIEEVQNYVRINF